jgi:TRAP-type C4-dicarboxylate transport system permease small subunit
VTGAASGKRLERALGLLHRLEDALLALILGLLVLLAPLQIFLRNFFDTGISWGDPLLRVLVLWVGMLGALAATRGRRQIGIDVLSHSVGERVQSGVGIVTSLFTSVVCSIVAYHSARFVAAEIEHQVTAFAGVPAWSCEIVIPLVFGLIALRYLLYSIGDLRDLLSGSPVEEG